LNCTFPPEIGPNSIIAVEDMGIEFIGVVGFVGEIGVVGIDPLVFVLSDGPDHHQPQADSESMSATCVDF
jgi:hypothetical protein